jgi:hypothetical protein
LIKNKNIGDAADHCAGDIQKNIQYFADSIFKVVLENKKEIRLFSFKYGNNKSKSYTLTPSGCGRQVVVLHKLHPVRRTPRRELQNAILLSPTFSYIIVFQLERTIGPVCLSS